MIWFVHFVFEYGLAVVLLGFLAWLVAGSIVNYFKEDSCQKRQQ
jgi:hypothetical protein